MFIDGTNSGCVFLNVVNIFKKVFHSSSLNKDLLSSALDIVFFQEYRLLNREIRCYSSYQERKRLYML